MANITITLRGFSEFQERLANYPAVQSQVMRAVFQQARAAGVGRAKKPLRGRGMDQAWRTIFGQYDDRHARIFTVMSPGSVLTIEEGRLPGRPPAGRALGRNLFGARGGSGGLSQEEQSLVWAYWRNVKQTGAQGKHFMEGVTDLMQERLPRWLQNAANRIVRKLAG